jgi:regulator of cell morphogenesis and NO signaling
MRTIDPTETLGALVTARPELAPRLDRLGLDYCCGGGRTLAEACAERGLDPAEVLETLAAEPAGPPAGWAELGPAELVDHLEAVHHTYLREALPRLATLVAKVAEVHGERHPELVEVRATFEELRADLEPHLLKEERVLFPQIRALDAAGDGPAPAVPCGSLRAPITVMLAEHDRAGELLGRLRERTGGFAVPADGCASYRALYTGLAELEADTHLHVHKENNVLFPAVLELETRAAR